MVACEGGWLVGEKGECGVWEKRKEKKKKEEEKEKRRAGVIRPAPLNRIHT